jgi:hypothetical protein
MALALRESRIDYFIIWPQRSSSEVLVSALGQWGQFRPVPLLSGQALKGSIQAELLPEKFPLLTAITFVLTSSAAWFEGACSGIQLRCVMS